MSNYEQPVYIKDGRVFDKNMLNIEKILHSKKLNYPELKQLMDPYFLDNQCETINIFIDLNDILKPMYNPSLNDEFTTIRTKNKMNIIAELINIVGHYRHFFNTKYGKFTTIILYYSDKKDTYLTGLDECYKNDFYTKRIVGESLEYFTRNKILYACIDIVKEYLNYIPHAYLINTGHIEPTALPTIINELELVEYNSNDYSIIMSDNPIYEMNLINNDNCLLFKNNGRGKSGVIDRYDLNNGVLKLENENIIPDESLLLINSILGYKSFNVSNVPKMGLKKAFNYIKKKHLNNVKLRFCNNIDFLKTEIINDLKPEEQDIIIRNMKLLNYKTYPLTESDKILLEEQFIDISDLEYIKEETLNNFDIHSVILFEYLFDGEFK